MTQLSHDYHDLKMLNEIAFSLNRAVDVQAVLQDALERLIDLLELETGWIFIRDSAAAERWFGRGYRVIATRNLPPGLHLQNPVAWDGGCSCQGLYNKGKMQEAYNEVRCSRLGDLTGGTNDLSVHASVPLWAGDEVVGIMNVAAQGWADFSDRALALMTNIGIQMGEALERARRYDQLREQRQDEQTLLLEFSNHLLAQATLDELVFYLLQRVRAMLRADAVALFLCDEIPYHLAFHSVDGWRYDPPLEIQNIENIDPIKTAIEEQQIVIAQQADLPVTLPWMDDEAFISHAYIPMVNDGNPLGVLMMNTRVAREWSTDDLRLVQLLANQAAITLETARLREQVLERERLEHELTIGQQIQRSMLPKSTPQLDGWDIAAYYQAARLVGGDFYDFFMLPEQDKLGMVIADVSDKGVPAALIMALSRTMIRTAAISHRTPAEALLKANDLIYADNDTDFFLTACYAILDVSTGQLDFSVAGHNPLFLVRSSGEALRLSTRGTVLGIFDSIPLNNESITLQNGDVLLAYTDGVTEAINHARDEFGEARLWDVLLANRNESSATIVEALVETIQSFADGADQFDDMTFFVLKCTGTPCTSANNSAT